MFQALIKCRTYKMKLYRFQIAKKKNKKLTPIKKHDCFIRKKSIYIYVIVSTRLLLHLGQNKQLMKHAELKEIF
jgi:hypothetical protein